MKDLWYAICTGVYASRFNLGGMVLVLSIWIILAELVLPRVLVDAIAYFCFGWMFLGKVCLPWMEQKLKELFD